MISSDTINKKILKYEYVSFDLYDTVFMRLVNSPEDVFKLVGSIYADKNFYQKRLWAQREAEKNKFYDEITLDDIYLVLNKTYDSKTSLELKQCELTVERDITVLNQEIKKVIDFCIDKEKKILFMSDMYLDKSFLSSVLKKNGILKYDYLFVSCDTKRRKSTKKMFPYVIKKLNINPKSIIHIGDAVKGDIIFPRMFGVETIPYTDLKHELLKKNKSLEEGIIEKLGEKKFENEKPSKYYEIGFLRYGPFLYGFSKWLLHSLEKGNIKKVYFCSRDGYMLKKAFDLINVNHEIKSYYLYMSKKSVALPLAASEAKLEELILYSFANQCLTVGEFITQLGLDPDECRNIVQEYYPNMNMTLFRGEVSKDRLFAKMINRLLIEKKDYVKDQGLAFLKYLENNDFFGEVALVDIGWRGSIQFALNKILLSKNIHITGYYVGIDKEGRFGKLNAHGYLFETEREEMYLKLMSCVGLFEMFGMAEHGTVLNYRVAEKVLPVLDKYEHYDNEKGLQKEALQIKEIQQGALDIIEKILNFDSFRNCQFDSKRIIENFLKLGIAPDWKIYSLFCDWNCNNCTTRKLVEYKGIKSYILHPKQLVIDFNNSYWKVGYIKRLFKCRKFCYPVYKILKITLG